MNIAKKSLLIGTVVLSFVGIIGTTTSKASAATITTSYTALKTAATKRNVETTGKNALYSKPGTVKGAKVVASKAKMATFKTSSSSAYYFRAYGYAKTNTGSVYYKVVSMNDKYRGYVYGGKTLNAFSGGVKSAKTTQSVDLPTGTTFYFNKLGKAYGTWTSPQYTQYKAKKLLSNVNPTSAAGKKYAADPLTVTKAVKKTREGWVYYYIEDAKHPEINGWIYSKAVLNYLDEDYYGSYGISVSYQDSESGKSVGNAFVGPYEKDSSTSYDELLNQVSSTSYLPSGYKVTSMKIQDGSNTTLSTGDTIAVGRYPVIVSVSK